MGKSFTRTDGLMMDSSVVAMDANGTPLSDALLHLSDTLSGSSKTVTDSRIKSNMRVCNAVFGTPANLTSDVSWTTSDGSVSFTYTLASGTTTTINFDLILFQT